MQKAIAVLVVLFGLSSSEARAQAPEARFADFSRFTKAIGTEIAIVDREGIVREGLLTAATADAVTMSFSGSPRTFGHDAIASAAPTLKLSLRF